MAKKNVKPAEEVKVQTMQIHDPLRKIRTNLIFIIVALCIFLYGNTLKNGYSMDDELVAYNHELVAKGINGFPEIFTSRYAVNATQNYEYRPIVISTFAIEYQFFGQNPAVSHFINIVLYALTCIVLFHLLLKLFHKYHWIFPATITILFVIHPIHTEVVASLKNRDEILSMLFALLAANRFFIFSDTNKFKYAVYGTLLMALSVLSKKSSAPMVVLIPMMIYFSSGLAFSKRTLILCLSLAGSYIIFRIMMFSLLEKDNLQRDLLYFENPLYVNGYGFFERIPMFFYTVGYYIKLLIFPHPLSVYYGYNHVPVAEWSNPLVWISILIIVPSGLYCLFNIKKKSPWMFGFLFFIIAISYFSNLVKPAPGMIAERFAFLSSVGFCIFISYWLLELFKVPFHVNTNSKLKYSGTLRLVAVALLFLSGIKVITRNNDWYSHTTIYKHDIIYTENSAKLNSLLGALYVDQLDKNRSAVMSLSSTPAALITPEQKKNLLTQQQIKIKMDSAIFHFNKALAIYPDYIAVNNNLGAVYFSYVDNADSAKKYFTRAVELDTDYVQALYNLASCYEREIGEYEEMSKYFNSIDSVEKDNASAAEWKNIPVNEMMEKFLKFFGSYDEMKARLVKTSNMAVGVLMQNRDFSQAKEEFVKTVQNNLSGKLAEKITPDVMDSLGNAMVENAKEIYHTMTLTELNIKTEKAIDKIMYPVIDSMVNGFYREIQVKKDEVPLLNAAFKNRSSETAENNLYQMMSCLNRSLTANPEYYISYTKLMSLYRDRNMGDSMISLSNRLMEVKSYLKADLYSSIANGYAMKGDEKEAAKYYDMLISEREKTLNRITIIYLHSAAAKFNDLSQSLYQYQIGTKRDIVNTCNYLATKYSAAGDQSSSQKYLLKAQQYK